MASAEVGIPANSMLRRGISAIIDCGAGARVAVSVAVFMVVLLEEFRAK